MKSVRWPLLAILILAAALRVIGLENRGIWYDDAFSLLLSQQSLENILIGTAADTMPPLYYDLLHFWMLVNPSLAWTRLLNVIFSLATIWFLYRTVAALASKRAGLWAAGLAAIAPFQIYHAQELRSYALLGLFEVAYLYFFARLWLSPQPGSRRHWLGFVLAGAGALWTHNLAAFALIVPDLFLLARRRWQRLGRVVSAQVLIGLLALPWLLRLPGQIQSIQGSFSIPRPGLTEVIQSLIIFTSNLPLPGLLLPAGLFISLLGTVLVIFEILREPGHGRGLGLLAWFAIAPPVMMLLVSYLMQPIFVTRGFIISALAYNGLAGYVIARRWPAVGILVASVFLAGALLSLPDQLSNASFPRSPFRQAANELAAAVQPADLVIHDNKLSQFPMRYYRPELSQRFLADMPGSGNDTLSLASQQATGQFADADIAAAVGSAQRVYFVVFTRTYAEYASLGLPEHPNLTWLRAHFQETDHQIYNDLEVFKFER